MTDVTFTAACDAGPGPIEYAWAWWKDQTPEDQRVQVQSLWAGGVMTLDPAHCRFGPRRLVLAGQMTRVDAFQAAERAAETLRWALMTMYGHTTGPGPSEVPLHHVTLSIRELGNIGPADPGGHRPQRSGKGEESHGHTG